MLKRLFFVAIAALNAAAAMGCSHGAPNAVGVVKDGSGQATIMAAGMPRKLGFDVERYNHLQRPSAPIKPLPPVQGVMPSLVDLRAQCSPVANQLDLNACTSFALGKGLREYLQGKRKEKLVPLSPLFLYYETRRLRGKEGRDCGATLTDAMKALSGSGIAPETSWPYDMLQFDKKPTDEAYQAARTYKLAGGLQLANLADIKKTLAKGTVVAFGMRVFSSYQYVGPDGMLPMPETGDVFVGGHAVSAVGYDDQKKVLIVRNSYGEEFGDHGYFYMPYDYATAENVMDIWTAK